MFRLLGILVGIGVAGFAILMSADFSTVQQFKVEIIRLLDEIRTPKTSGSQRQDTTFSTEQVPPGSTLTDRTDGLSIIAGDLSTEPSIDAPSVENLEYKPVVDLPVRDTGGMNEASDSRSLESNKIDTFYFWQPFNSEISARGFATRLSDLLHTDVAVEKIGRSRYRVAFQAKTASEIEYYKAQLYELAGLREGEGH